jgi:nucleoside-diphosphate-sugar epimerase
MRIAITGAAGGIGRILTENLADEGHELILIDNVAPEEATVFGGGPPAWRVAAPLSPHWPYHKVDLRDIAGLRDALSGAGAIVHLAAVATGLWEQDVEIMEVGVMGTFNLYKCAVSIGCTRVVNASSINAFGSFFWRVYDADPVRARLPLMGDEQRVPEDPYSLSKGITEDIGWTFRRAYGVEAVNLRFSSVWKVPRYEETLAAGLPVTQEWATDLWQWVHVLDLVQAVRLAVTGPDPTSEAIVVGAGDTRAPEATVDLICRFKPGLERNLREPLPGRSPLLSIARARQFLGYEPQFSFDGAAVARVMAPSDNSDEKAR